MKNSTYSIWLLAILFFTITACSNSKKLNEEVGNELTAVVAEERTSGGEGKEREDAVLEKADSLFASIHRTPCYGKCPSYKVQMFKSGYALYDGMMFVERKGRFEARFTKDKMDMIVAKAKALGYLDFKERYDDNVTDLPSCTTSLLIEGKRKTVYNRYGGPEQLREFEKFMDQVVESANWKLLNAPDQVLEEDED
jgi:hypothetical protein